MYSRTPLSQPPSLSCVRLTGRDAKVSATDPFRDDRRTLLGWSPGGVETYTVALVTDAAEMDQAKAELTGSGPTGYVVLRVDEGEYTSPNRGGRCGC